MDPSGHVADEIRELAERSRDALGTLRNRLERANQERRESAEQLGKEALERVERLATEIGESLSSDFAEKQEQIAEELRNQSDQDRDAFQKEREDFEAQREAWVAERADWEKVRGQIEAELSALESRLTTEAQSLKDQQHTPEASEADSELQEQLYLAIESQKEAETHLAEVQARNAELSEALEAARASAENSDELGSELATLQEKFEMALADLQAHREHVAALEEALAARPEADTADQDEIANLRQERDELARQLEEASHSGAGEPSAELEDLRARFEMAVEDVRQLKNENSDLRDRLSSSAPAGDADGNDWEAQKRRLLAALEGEGEPEEPERQEERAKIAGTIQITDQVVAEKDREIEELRAQLETQGAAPETAPEEANAQAAELLDNDEVIRSERERLAALEEEWKEKLRAAELELSVERAKITRAQSELEEQQIELETLRATTPQAGAGESRRNWLNKLGLGDGGQ